MEDLIHRIQYHDDESAFNQLYKQNVVRLFHFAFSFVKDKEIAEEIVNDVFLKIWLDRAKLNTIRNLSVYLYVAVKNASLNHFNRVAAKNGALTESFEQSFEFVLNDPDPEQLLIGKQMKLTIAQAVNQLPPKCKVIFKMVKEDQLTVNEVAQILEISNKTVFAQLSIAVKKMEELLIGKKTAV